MTTCAQYLVATSHDVLLVNTSDASFRSFHSGYGLYYGITWDTSSVYIACRWYPWYTLTAKIERPRLITITSDRLPMQSTYPYCAGGLHQILMSDDALLCTCSREDSLLIRSGGTWERWYPSPDHKHHGRDTHHFNSVWIKDDLLYVVGHNNGPSDIWVFTWPGRELVTKHRAGNRIHNVWTHDGDITFCNSRSGTVETVRGEVLATPRGFPRGIAISDDECAVGVSTIASRRQRLRTTGCLAIYDPDWREMTRIPLGTCGQILEVRRIDKRDHAHGPHEFPLSRVLTGILS